ncbi:MAG: NAD(P)/FAD-dependent oxidoreductase [Pikeienuella sp.]
MDEVECIVVGAGVIGLAIARALARQGREVLVLEARDAFGTVTSARNSEVIHAGIYYPRDSLKARFCVEGRKRLYDYCATRHVGVRACGKLIVATQADELSRLVDLAEKARANGVEDVRQLSQSEAVAMEPALACVGALWSPSTGVIDSHGLMLSLLGEAEGAGAMLALNAPVTDISAMRVVTVGGDAPMRLRARVVINAAGHGAPSLSEPLYDAPRGWFAKGNYFRLEGKAPFSRLIYPAPQAAGLGVHLTLDMGGQARFGPDVEWVDEETYQVDARRGDSFYAAVRRYWPDLPDKSLAPDYAGVRPKLGPEGSGVADFTIHGADRHGIDGYLALYGIESPGLTASLAIADYVSACVEA